MPIYTLASPIETKRAYLNYKDWEVVACMSRDNSFEQMSFVNGICTWRGGKHVDHVADAIAKRLTEMIKAKNKKERKCNNSVCEKQFTCFYKNKHY